MLFLARSIPFRSSPTHALIVPLPKRRLLFKHYHWKADHVERPFLSVGARKYATEATKKEILEPRKNVGTKKEARIGADGTGTRPTEVKNEPPQELSPIEPRRWPMYAKMDRKLFDWDTIPPRSHPSYDILRDMDKLEAHRGKKLVLPYLGPKYRGSISGRLWTHIDQSLLVTEEFIQLARRFHDEIELDRDDVARPGYGMILQGPDGSGKWSLTFLLASLAYANNCLVLFDSCFNAGEKRAETDGVLLQLTVFRGLNHELLSSIVVSSEKRGRESALECLDAILDGLEDWRLFDVVLTSLASYTHRPVVFALAAMTFIEYRGQTNHEWWSKWYECSSCVQGARTYPIFSGATNHTVKRELNATQRNWVTEVQPWSPRDMVQFYLELPDNCPGWLEELLRTQPEETGKLLVKYGGGNPSALPDLPTMRWRTNAPYYGVSGPCDNLEALEKFLIGYTKRSPIFDPRGTALLDRVEQYRETTFPRFLERVYELSYMFPANTLSRAERGLYKTPEGYKCPPDFEKQLYELFVIGRSQLPPFTRKSSLPL